MDTGTEWVTEGARVAELRGYAQETASTTTIARLTATQIVLANGHRYNRRTLRRVGDSGGYGSSRLEPIESSQVQAVLAGQGVKTASYEIGGLAHRYSGKSRDDALAVLDEMARIIASTRKSLEG
jgi:hypothetical protein